MVATILILTLALLLAGWLLRRKNRKFIHPSEAKLSESDRRLLAENVDYYGGLSAEEKKRFESELAAFLTTIKIVTVGCEATDLDRILIGASATIPLFGFPEWHYPHLNDVVLYPRRFNSNFDFEAEDATILGMVGTGHLSGTMFLSQADLRHGYSSSADRQNVGIHEFTHLVDGYDGSIEGIPTVYLKQPAILPWIDLIRLTSAQIRSRDSDVNPYALTNAQEFLAVTAEYFFEHPKRLKAEHPELYDHLNVVFNQDPAKLNMSRLEPPMPNDLCYCGSGKKFKKCHGTERS